MRLRQSHINRKTKTKPITLFKMRVGEGLLAIPAPTWIFCNLARPARASFYDATRETSEFEHPLGRGQRYTVNICTRVQVILLPLPITRFVTWDPKSPYGLPHFNPTCRLDLIGSYHETLDCALRLVTAHTPFLIKRIESTILSYRFEIWGGVMRLTDSYRPNVLGSADRFPYQSPNHV